MQTIKYNFKVSYFNNIRNFKSDCVLISTAMYDPKWYHRNLGKDIIYTDKRGIVNGIRLECLHAVHTDEEVECITCDKSCAPNCKFLTDYYTHLESLDFETVKSAMIEIAKELVDRKFVIPTDNNVDIVLLVHEKPSSPCSERMMLVKWFKAHGIELQEYACKTS